MFSPAIKRWVICLNPGNFEKKLLSSCFCERYKRAALEIISRSIFLLINLSNRLMFNLEVNFITEAPVYFNQGPASDSLDIGVIRRSPNREEEIFHFPFEICHLSLKE